MRLRRRQARNLLCLLMLANGTPMLVAGDEFLNTQRGNNNPYNQDNGTTWLDWDRLEANADFFRFARLLIAFRKAHPTIGRSRFWRGDARFLSGDDRSIALHPRGESEDDDDLCLMANAGPVERRFSIPGDGADPWFRVVDTSMESPSDIAEAGDEIRVEAADYAVAARSVVLLRTRRPEVTADGPSGS